MKNASSFLARWSRRKRAAREGHALEPAPAIDGERNTVPESNSAPPELPPIEELQGTASDYHAFMQPHVDEGLKRTALKQLFKDPYFNQMDGLDVYIDDYGKPDPLPAAMLAALNHARGLLDVPPRDSEFQPEGQLEAHPETHPETQPERIENPPIQKKLA